MNKKLLAVLILSISFVSFSAFAWCTVQTSFDKLTNNTSHALEINNQFVDSNKTSDMGILAKDPAKSPAVQNHYKHEYQIVKDDNGHAAAVCDINEDLKTLYIAGAKVMYLKFSINTDNSVNDACHIIDTNNKKVDSCEIKCTKTNNMFYPTPHCIGNCHWGKARAYLEMEVDNKS